MPNKSAGRNSSCGGADDYESLVRRYEAVKRRIEARRQRIEALMLRFAQQRAEVERIAKLEEILERRRNRIEARNIAAKNEEKALQRNGSLESISLTNASKSDRIKGRYIAVDSEDDFEWRTINGAHVPFKDGEPQNEVGRAIALSDKIKSVDENSFADAIISAKSALDKRDAWRVDANGAGHYAGSKLYTSDGGSCVAVESDGNIVSLCKMDGDATSGTDMLKYAIANGGDRLDAFGPVLYRFYAKNGFEPVSWTPFNEGYAPDGWWPGIDKAEPIIFYKYTGQNPSIGYGEFLLNTAPHIGDNGYYDAKTARDGEL